MELSTGRNTRCVITELGSNKNWAIFAPFAAAKTKWKNPSTACRIQFFQHMNNQCICQGIIETSDLTLADSASTIERYNRRKMNLMLMAV